MNLAIDITLAYMLIQAFLLVRYLNDMKFFGVTSSG
jgi:hypothetical protein